ncbi:MAG: 50S ribosomal protein L25 [Cyanobacteria bacterium]|nr:50S ribosomal protein L25 [Cyanobacteriota bacterium]
MEKFKLKASKREDKTPNQIRREGQVPATMYGPDVEPENIQFGEKEFSRLPDAAYSHLIELDLDGKPVSVIIRHVQRKSTNERILNAQFYRVSQDKKLTVNVPIHLTGTAPAVVEGCQLFESNMEVEIECLPSNIPDFLVADISVLEKPDDVLHFGDLKISDSIRIVGPLDGVICKVVAPKASGDDKAEAKA